MTISIPSVETKIAVVEQYIYKKKGVRVKIVFNHPFFLEQHLKDLDYAYLIAYEEDNSSRKTS